MGKIAEKQLFWRQAMREHRQSNLTVPEYCRQQGLSSKKFYYWRKRLGDANKRQVNGAKGGVHPGKLPFLRLC